MAIYNISQETMANIIFPVAKSKSKYNIWTNSNHGKGLINTAARQFEAEFCGEMAEYVFSQRSGLPWNTQVIQNGFPYDFISANGCTIDVKCPIKAYNSEENTILKWVNHGSNSRIYCWYYFSNFFEFQSVSDYSSGTLKFKNKNFKAKLIPLGYMSELVIAQSKIITTGKGDNYVIDVNKCREENELIQLINNGII